MAAVEVSTAPTPVSEPQPTSSRKPASIELGPVTHHNVKQLRVLNAVLFPVSYSEKFYKDATTAGDAARFGAMALGACAAIVWCDGCVR
jgi:hypothetical protein